MARPRGGGKPGDHAAGAGLPCSACRARALAAGRGGP